MTRLLLRATDLVKRVDSISIRNGRGTWQNFTHRYRYGTIHTFPRLEECVHLNGNHFTEVFKKKLVLTYLISTYLSVRTMVHE